MAAQRSQISATTSTPSSTLSTAAPSSVAILPKHALENAVKQRRFPMAYSTSTPPERIIGCGPYQVKEVRPGQSVLLERNPEYWVADSQGRRRIAVSNRVCLCVPRFVVTRGEVVPASNLAQVAPRTHDRIVFLGGAWWQSNENRQTRLGSIAKHL